MSPARKALSAVIGVAAGLAFGFVLFNLYRAVFGSTWSVAEGGPWLVIYSPFILLAAVGGIVGFFKGFKKTFVSCMLTLIFSLVGGLILMFIAGMFVGGGAIYVVAVVGVVAGFIVTMNMVVK
jgi:hypothetical protein